MSTKRFSRLAWTPELDAMVKELMGRQPPATSTTIAAKLNRKGFACSLRSVSRRMNVLRESNGAGESQEQSTSQPAPPSAAVVDPLEDAMTVASDAIDRFGLDPTARMAIDWVFPMFATCRPVRRVEGVRSREA